jgi:uncharacterized membrane protein YkoI
MEEKLMRTLTAFGAATLLLAPLNGLAKPTPQPRITQADATRTALSAVPGGNVISAELESEHHQLIYSFDVAVPGKSGVEEVQVSAMTGRIVSLKHEGPLKEKVERAAEKLERH